jgi:hypothetical protein
VAEPTILSIEGVPFDEFMRVVDTWPSGRINILHLAQRVLEERFKRKRSRNIDVLENWFGELREAGAGMNGTVFSACIRHWDTKRWEPTEPSTCILLPTKTTFMGSKRHLNIVRVIVKVFKMKPGEAVRVPNVQRYGNPYREVVMGRLLNLLVLHNITPHLPLIYENFTIGESGIGFVTELSHMTFSDFLVSNVMREKDDNTVERLLNVALLQICHGMMCAQEYFDFRHNDLHSSNVMMTFVSDARYNYKVGSELFAIPNYSMCWKLIDFGLSSSFVFGESDVVQAYAYHKVLRALKPDAEPKAGLGVGPAGTTSSNKRSGEGIRPAFKGYALEMWDLVLFLMTAITAVHDSSHDTERKALIIRVLKSKLATIRAVCRDAGEIISSTLETAYLQGMAKLEDDTTQTVLTKEYAWNARYVSLLKHVFFTWAGQYRVGFLPHDSVIFSNKMITKSEMDGVLAAVTGAPLRK